MIILNLNLKEHLVNPKLTIFQVDNLMKNLSEIGKSTLGKDSLKIKEILTEIYLSMTSLECKWITRIILKNLILCIEPKFYFDAFHGWYII